MSNSFRPPTAFNSTTPISELGLPERIIVPLGRKSLSMNRMMPPITTIGDLQDRCECELSDIRQLGPTGIEFIRDALRQYGFSIRPCHWVSNAAAYAQAKASGFNPCGYMTRHRGSS